MRLTATLGLVLALALAAAPAQGQGPDGLVQSHLRTAVVTLPEGVAISPGAADGLVACSDTQLALRSATPVACPDASQIGTAEVHTELLRESLKGAVYVREQTPDELFRLALTASGDGIHLKLPGAVRLDPLTGRVTVTFDNLPQLPFSTLDLRFKGGPRAVLANPLDCGTYAAQSVFTPWSGGAPAAPASPFTIGDGSCPRTLPFEPGVSAGTVNPVAGASTPLVFRVRRDDGNQELSRVALELPAGVTAVTRDVPLCPVARAAAADCDEASRIGVATVGAGAGAAPLYLRGTVFLTEAHRGGQFGLAIVVPAIAGPFDLGTVVVQAAVHVDPQTAALRVESDPLPRILMGVPLRLRDVHLAIDRPGFIRNPTSCAPLEVGSTIDAVQGAIAPRTSRFQVGDCAALPLSPRMTVALTGRGNAQPDQPLGLRMRLRTRDGDANLDSVAFTLPPEVAFNALTGGPGLCTREQLAQRRCPAASRIGSVRADTPLLSRPLKGPVYFIRGVRGDAFPKLAMQLDGQVRIDLLGSTAATRRGLRTSFDDLPDVPIGRFSLDLDRGLLTPTRDLCSRRIAAGVRMVGHHGGRATRRLRVAVPCSRSPLLRIRAVRRTGRLLAIRGAVRRSASRSVAIVVRCSGRASRDSARVRRGRWRAAVPIPAGCPSDARPRLRVRYPGGSDLDAQTVGTRIRASG